MAGTADVSFCVTKKFVTKLGGTSRRHVAGCVYPKRRSPGGPGHLRLRARQTSSRLFRLAVTGHAGSVSRELLGLRRRVAEFRSLGVTVAKRVISRHLAAGSGKIKLLGRLRRLLMDRLRQRRRSAEGGECDKRASEREIFPSGNEVHFTRLLLNINPGAFPKFAVYLKIKQRRCCEVFALLCCTPNERRSRAEQVPRAAYQLIEGHDCLISRHENFFK